MAIDDQVRGVVAVARAGLRIERPDRLPRALAAAAAAGPTLAGAAAGAVARYPNGVAIVDDDGSITYGRLWVASDRAARRMRRAGVGPRSTIGILAGNGRGFVIAVLAASKLGADVVFLNTSFAPPQLHGVVTHEHISHVLHGRRFDDVVQGCGATLLRIEDLDVDAGARWVPLLPSRREARSVVLTSGTTGRPKGAARTNSAGAVNALGGLLDRIPIRSGDTTVIAAPLFHGWGLAHLGIAIGLASTVVLADRFNAEDVLESIGQHRANGLVVVPVMLQRILDAEREREVWTDTNSLRYIASSGSAIPTGVVIEALDRFGPVLYNTYGSTEVALASVAGPTELIAAPSTAGRVVAGVRVEILDEHGLPVAPGQLGRIFVGSGQSFDGYTGGGDKERIAGMLSTGDIGRFDGPLLMVEGRDDDMIVSGGENVFPQAVEDAISQLAAVTDVAVVGVPDDEFGQRLAAFVVRRPGAKLSARRVRDHVGAQLARFMVPRDVRFVDELPRTATGKLRRRDLG